MLSPAIFLGRGSTRRGPRIEDKDQGPRVGKNKHPLLKQIDLETRLIVRILMQLISQSKTNKKRFSVEQG